MTVYEMRTYTLHVGNMAEAVEFYTSFIPSSATRRFRKAARTRS